MGRYGRIMIRPYEFLLPSSPPAFLPSWLPCHGAGGGVENWLFWALTGVGEALIAECGLGVGAGDVMDFLDDVDSVDGWREAR